MGCWGRGRYLALICVTKRSRSYNGRGGWRSTPFISLFFLYNSTVTLLHDANDNNDEDACMERRIFRLFSSLSAFKTPNQYTERASERARRGGKRRGTRPGKGGNGGKGEFRTFVCIIINLSFVLDIKRACNHHTLQ